jgi:hypothetical protein
MASSLGDEGGGLLARVQVIEARQDVLNAPAGSGGKTVLGGRDGRAQASDPSSVLRYNPTRHQWEVVAQLVLRPSSIRPSTLEGQLFQFPSPCDTSAAAKSAAANGLPPWVEAARAPCCWEAVAAMCYARKWRGCVVALLDGEMLGLYPLVLSSSLDELYRRSALAPPPERPLLGSTSDPTLRDGHVSDSSEAQSVG